MESWKVFVSDSEFSCECVLHLNLLSCELACPCVYIEKQRETARNTQNFLSQRIYRAQPPPFPSLVFLPSAKLRRSFTLKSLLQLRSASTEEEEKKRIIFLVKNIENSFLKVHIRKKVHKTRKLSPRFSTPSCIRGSHKVSRAWQVV